MAQTDDVTNIAPHGLFYMENAGGTHSAAPASTLAEHQPSCFSLEEEKGEHWKGSGATRPAINESRPSL